MGYDNGRIGLVTMLSSVTRTTTGGYVKVFMMNDKFLLGRFFQYSDRDGAGMDFSCGSVLPSMTTRLILEDFRSFLTAYLKNC
jgi:hypothetical protein